MSPQIGMLTSTAALGTAGCGPCSTRGFAASVDPAANGAPDQSSTPRVSWSGVLGVEGMPTGDGRMIERNALSWEPPLPIRYVPEDNGEHAGAIIVGQITGLSRAQNGDILGEGFFDLSMPHAVQAARGVESGMQDGVSMDLDDVSFELRVKADLLQEDEDGQTVPSAGTDQLPPTDANGMVTLIEMKADDELMVTTSARIRASTLVGIPAFDTARIALTEPMPTLADQPAAPAPAPAEAPPSGQAPSAGQLPDGSDCSCDEGAPGYDPGCDCSGNLNASAVPDAPPVSWFSDPDLHEPTALRVTAEGQIFGHLAIWGTCHISHAHTGCVTPPHSATGYAHFRTGSVLTAEGAEVSVGHVTLDTLHAGPTLSAAAAAAHYERTGAVVADVAAGEDAFGIWVAGALRPSVTPDQVRALRASPLSGDWRRLSGNLELVAALAVNVPGFPVPRPRGLVASGVITSLVASGMVPPRKVRRPGTLGALSVDDLRYLKRLADRERREEQQRAAGVLPQAAELARRVRASALAVRVHAARD